MTREEAIKILNRDDDNMRKGYFCINDFLAIEALKSEEPCEDCVSRQAVIKELNDNWLSGSCARRIIDEQIDKVKALPSVTPTRKKGKWIVEDSGNYNGKYSTCYCSNCNDYYTRAWKEMKFCPNCGADMRGSENE